MRLKTVRCVRYDSRTRFGSGNSHEACDVLAAVEKTAITSM
jgi:hypothetical protein